MKDERGRGFLRRGDDSVCGLAAIHLVLTLRDLRHPRYFKPIDEGLVRVLKDTGMAVDGLVPVAPGAAPHERPDERSVDRADDRGREQSVAFFLPYPGAGMLAEQDEVKRYRWSAGVDLD